MTWKKLWIELHPRMNGEVAASFSRVLEPPYSALLQSNAGYDRDAGVRCFSAGLDLGFMTQVSLFCHILVCLWFVRCQATTSGNFEGLAAYLQRVERLCLRLVDNPRRVVAGKEPARRSGHI